MSDKEKIANELLKILMEKKFYRYGKFYDYVKENYDEEYLDFMKQRKNSGWLHTLVRSNYQKKELKRKYGIENLRYSNYSKEE